MPIERFNQLNEELKKTVENNDIAKEVIENAKKKFDEAMQGILNENPNWNEMQGHRARAAKALILNKKFTDTQREIMKEYSKEKFEEIQEILDPKDQNKRYKDAIKNVEGNTETIIEE